MKRLFIFLIVLYVGLGYSTGSSLAKQSDQHAQSKNAKKEYSEGIITNIKNEVETSNVTDIDIKLGTLLYTARYVREFRWNSDIRQFLIVNDPVQVRLDKKEKFI